MNKTSLRFKLFLAFALVIALFTALSLLFYHNVSYRDRIAWTESLALAQADMLGGAVDFSDGVGLVEHLSEQAKQDHIRISLLDQGGRVIADSDVAQEELALLDSHGDRPEIRQAMAEGSGTSVRFSTSLNVDAIYAAQKLPDGRFIRVAVPLADVDRGYRTELFSYILLVLAAAALCLLISGWFTARIRTGVNSMAATVSQIATDSRKRRLHDVPGSEFEPLAKAVNQMADRIEEQISTISEQHLQIESILDGMQEGVILCGADGRVKQCNNAALRLFPNLLAGRLLMEAIPVPELQREFEQVASLAKQDSNWGGFSRSVQFSQNPGKFYNVSMSSLPNGEQDGKIVLVVYDASELMRLERVRKDFIANISHELRTPLTAISGYAETLLSMDNLDADQRRFITIIHNHAATLGRIITDLIYLSRLESGQEELNMTDVDVKVLLEKSVMAFQDQAAAKGAVIELDVENNLTVTAGQQLLQRVLANLLQNALRYTPEHGKILISARRDGKQCLISVADQGPGIPLAEQQRIFERFYQVEKQRNSGTAGLGLAISKHIVEMCGGRIWAESPYLEYATAMRFSLPLGSQSE